MTDQPISVSPCELVGKPVRIISSRYARGYFDGVVHSYSNEEKTLWIERTNAEIDDPLMGLYIWQLDQLKLRDGDALHDLELV